MTEKLIQAAEAFLKAYGSQESSTAGLDKAAALAREALECASSEGEDRLTPELMKLVGLTQAATYEVCARIADNSRHHDGLADQFRSLAGPYHGAATQTLDAALVGPFWHITDAGRVALTNGVRNDGS